MISNSSSRSVRSFISCKLFCVVVSVLQIVGTGLVWGVENPSNIYRYNSTDGGILYSVTHGNRWAIINLGTSASGGNASSQLFDMTTGEHFPVTYQGHTLTFHMASDDGNIVVGNYGGYAISYDRATNTLRSYPNRPLWKNGQLIDCTPDGRYAVGYYEGYLGNMEGSDLPNDWFYRTLFVDTYTGDTIYTPGLPDPRGGRAYQSIKFTNITPDGRYISGAVDWYMNGYGFIYDVENQRTLRNTSFMELYGGDVAKNARRAITDEYTVTSCSGSTMSPSGKSIGGSARIRFIDGTTASVPCVYFIDNDSLAVYAHAEDGGVGIYAMDDAGTFFGCNETGTPLRSLKILYDGKYWVTLNQICRQRYGYDFFERTGYERTGTIMGVSADGHRFIAFPDPMGESYCFDFGMSVEEACAGLDFLGSYTVTPEAGAQFSKFSSVEVKFDRPVQVLGSGQNVHLVDSKGNVVANGLTSSSGLTLKTNSRNTIVANFRTRSLAAGEAYTVVIDSGAVATSVDAECVNSEICIPYTGRASVPVQLTDAAPEDGSTLTRLDNVSNYILLTFDCRVKLTDKPFAYLERLEDGSRACEMHMVAGTAEETRQQVLLYSDYIVSLLLDRDYRVVVAPGSIVDCVGDPASANDTIAITYHGNYVRTVPTGDVLFSDSWDNIAESLQVWLRYDGDRNTPMSSMQAWEFDNDNQPWNFSIRESESSYDYCAASHSLYAPSGRSDDWMMTPQITIPDDGRCNVQFDAQSYYFDREDTLEVYVWPEDWVLSYLSEEWMEVARDSAQLVFRERLTPGETQEYLDNEWTHYTIDLAPWAGQAVYICFVNHNRNQSAIFVDNVVVEREVFFNLAFNFENRVVDLDALTVNGVLTPKKAVNDIRLVLRDADGLALDSIIWQGITTSVKDRAMPFTFAKMLPLVKGSETAYSIDVTVGDHAATYNGIITDLLFLPERRVALEEMTGIDCSNCPLGIAVIERMEKNFGNHFIPISIHTYTGDPMASGLMGYSAFLGLNAAPTGRIDRTAHIAMPIVSGDDGGYAWTGTREKLWYDAVAERLSEPTLFDFSLRAFRPDDRNTEYVASVTPAVNIQNQHLALFVVVLEDSLCYYQLNAYGTVKSSALGDWGEGGIYSGVDQGGYVYPYLHKDVARAIVGDSYGGTIGLIPASLTAGETYTATLRAPFPSTVVEPSQAHVVALLIDSQTGEVVNAAAARYEEGSGLNTTMAQPTTTEIFDLQGRSLGSSMDELPKGIYLIGGRKVVVK